MLKNFTDKIFKGVAIYLSDNFIDVIQGSLSVMGLKVTSVQRIATEKNLKNRPFEEIKTEIDRILNKVFDIKTEMPFRIAINIKSEDFTLRRFMIPNVPDQEIPQIIGFEVQKYIPNTLDDLSYTYIKCDKREGQIDIMFGGTEKRIISEIAQYFHDKHIISSIIKASPNLISKVIGMEKGFDINDAYLSVHYEPPNKVLLNVMFKKEAYFSREIYIISSDEEFNATEFNYPLLKNVWGLIEQEVIRSVEYVKRELNINLNTYVISGFTEDITENQIAKDNGVKFRRISLTTFKNNSIESKDRYMPGLSLLFDTLHTPSLNLAPKPLVLKDYWTFKQPVLISIGLFFAIIVIHIFVSMYAIMQQADVVKLQKQFASSGNFAINTTATQLDVYKADLMKKTKVIGDVSNKIKAANFLDNLGEILTLNACITSISFDNKTKICFLNGIVYSPTGGGISDINRIVSNIKENTKIMSEFNDVNLLSAKKSKYGDKDVMVFDIQLCSK